MNTNETFPVHQVARLIGVAPKKISWLLYNECMGKRVSEACRIIGGNRQIPAKLVDEFRAECQRRNWLSD